VGGPPAALQAPVDHANQEAAGSHRPDCYDFEPIHRKVGSKVGRKFYKAWNH
jgi:hypothetical protein